VTHDDIGSGHVHDWGPKRYIDKCHWVLIEKTCKTCGCVHEEGSPRDFDLNPLQVAFANQNCERCRLLVRGMEPAVWSA
jgi:hypothetical protein